tara:strand:- start:249 stop:440 length:192 start_codon:yes stop_codon:yes gene_type:complete
MINDSQKSRQELTEILKKKDDENFNQWANRFIRTAITESGSDSNIKNMDIMLKMLSLAPSSPL